MTGRLAESRRTLVEAMPGWRRNGVFDACGAMALVLAELGAWADAARLGAASIASVRRAQMAWHP